MTDGLVVAIVVFIGLQFLVALANLIFCEKMKCRATCDKLVSVLIPARNEERNIATIIRDVLSQKHPNFELIVCDDQSSDCTASIVQQFAADDPRVRLIRAGELPAGWLGKNHACYCLAKEAVGHYYLFLDADVRIGPDCLSQTVLHAQKLRLDMLSVFPKQIMQGWGEKTTVPIMNYVLLSLLPLPLVRLSRRPSLSAANGQFLFFTASAYRLIGPHETLKSERAEDIATARLLKSEKLTVSCMVGNDQITCRMYQGWNEAVTGFSKNIIAYFGNSFIAAVLFWLVTTLGWIFVFWKASFLLAFATLSAYLLTRVFVSLCSRQNVAENLLLFPFQQFSMGITIALSAWSAHKKQQLWKGRNIIS